MAKVATEHKELHGGISKIGKAIDRVSISSCQWHVTTIIVQRLLILNQLLLNLISFQKATLTAITFLIINLLKHFQKMQIFAQVRSQCNALLHSSQCSVADLGEGPWGPSPKNWGPKGQKKFLEAAPHPPSSYLRVWMTGPPPYLKVWIWHWCWCYGGHLLQDKFDFRLNI